MSFNPLSEVRYRYRLAVEHLERAEKLFTLGDWAGTTSASQLAVENFAKTAISIFEVPTWSHDPSNQLNNILEKMPRTVKDIVKELANIVREIAPEHGRTSYGEPTAGLVPSDIYKEKHASNAFEKGKKAKNITEKVLKELNIKI